MLQKKKAIVEVCILSNIPGLLLSLFVSSVLLHVDEKILHSVLDELVYKLSSTTNPVTGNATTKLLLSVAESHPQLVELLSTRYKGLSLYFLSQGRKIPE